MSRAPFAILVPCSLALAACAPVATFPPDEGSVSSLTSARTEPVPTLMTESIRYVHRQHGDVAADFAINLPPGTQPQVYDWVIGRLGSGHPMEDPGEYTYHVTKVRVRGMNSQVDVFYPAGDGYEFATLTFYGDLIQGYHPQATRVWHTGDRPPPPNYMPRHVGPPDLASDPPEPNEPHDAEQTVTAHRP